MSGDHVDRGARCDQAEHRAEGESVDQGPEVHGFGNSRICRHLEQIECAVESRGDQLVSFIELAG